MKRHLAKALPELGVEVAGLLEKTGRLALAAQVPSLLLEDRCRCGDNFCATIYTVPPPTGPWGPQHECIDLDADQGMIVLDVVGERIVAIEILNRDEIRAKVLRELP